MSNVVPFGKYKNQPLAALAQDKSYCEWLAGQGWVAEKFPEIHTIIINNFAEPSDTPEHNALQLRFLENGLRLKVALCVALFKQPHAHWFRQGMYLPLFVDAGEPMFEAGGIDVAWTSLLWYPRARADSFWKPNGEHIERHQLCWMQYELRLSIECKPSLGDDYPAVLRFMHSLGGLKAVVAQEYNFRGGTVEQVQKLFQASGILLLDMPSLESLPEVRCLTEEELPSAQEYVRR